MKGTAIALLMLGLSLAVLAGPASAAPTLALSDPVYDSFYFTPLEELTVTNTGLTPATNYDMWVVFPNGTATGVELNNQTPDSSGKTVWKFAIPADFEGSYWVYTSVNNSMVVADSAFFMVRLFDLQASFDHQVYLPGDTVTVYYFTQQIKDQKPLPAGNGHWRATITRDNGTGPDIIDTIGASFTAPQGSFTFLLPSGTRAGSYSLTVTFNDTTDKHSQSRSITLRAGALNVNVFTDRSTYTSGASVVVTVSAITIGGSRSEATSGVVITTRMEERDVANATWVTDAAYTVPSQTTDVTGGVSFVIVLEANIPDDTQYRVTVTGTKVGATGEASDAFTIRASSTLLVDLTLDKTTYKPGDTIRAKLAFTSSNATLVTGALYLWIFTNSATDAILVQEYGPGTSTGSEKSYAIPADFSGSINIDVVVYTPDDNTYSRSDSADVFSWALLINPSKATYGPGDTIRVDVELVSDRITSPTFIYAVDPGSGGDPIASGTVPGNRTLSFSFKVPAQADEIYFVHITASGSGLVVQDQVTLRLDKYVALQITIPDGSYKPGDTVLIHWKLVSVGNATLPPTVDITVMLTSGAGASQRFERSGSEGTVPFVVPATAAAGDLLISVTASDHTGGSFSSSSVNSVYVRTTAGPSPATSAGNNAGLALGIGALALILGLIALLMIMRKPRAPGSMSSSAPSSFGELKHEAPKKEETMGNEPPKTL